MSFRIVALVIFYFGNLHYLAHAKLPKKFVHVFSDFNVGPPEAKLLHRKMEHLLRLSEPFQLKGETFLRIDDDPQLVNWSPGLLSITREKKKSIPEAEKSIGPEMTLNLMALGRAIFDSEFNESGHIKNTLLKNYFLVYDTKRRLLTAELNFEKANHVFRNMWGPPEANQDALLDLKTAQNNFAKATKAWENISAIADVMHDYDLVAQLTKSFANLFSQLFAASFAEHGQALVNLNDLELKDDQRKGLTDLEKTFSASSRLSILLRPHLMFRDLRSEVWQKKLRNLSLRDRIYYLHRLMDAMKKEIKAILEESDDYLSDMSFRRIPFPNYFLLYQLNFNPKVTGLRLLEDTSNARCDQSLFADPSLD